MDLIKMIPRRKKEKPCDKGTSKAEEKIIMPDEICVSCGRKEYIPEGYMICWECRTICERY